MTKEVEGKMRDIDLLIINPRIEWCFSHSSGSNGPIMLASYLYEKGFNVRVIDDNTIYKKYTLDDFVDYINLHHVKTIAFSVCTLNAYNSYSLAKELRNKFPKKIFIAGGLHTFDSAEEMIEYFDIVFKGEAELSLEKFMGILKNQSTYNDILISQIKNIPGLLFKTSEEIFDTGKTEIIEDLDGLPPTNYDLLNLDDYIKTKYDYQNIITRVIFQRGCVYNCSFCKSKVIASKIRNNSAPYMIKEIQRLYEKYNSKSFFITDSNFTLNKPRMNEFCSLMVSSGLSKKINLRIQSSVSIPLSDEEIVMLREAGVRAFFIGIERFDDSARKLIAKSGTSAQVTRLIKSLHEHKIKVIANLLFNFPFDTEELIEKETRLLELNFAYIDFLVVNYLSPIPGTKIYKDHPDTARWYLRKDYMDYQATHYDFAYNIDTPVLKLNLFKLPSNTIIKLRNLKEIYQWKTSLRTSSAFLRTMLLLDLCLGKISYYVARISPILEKIVFKPFKILHTEGYKRYFDSTVEDEK